MSPFRAFLSRDRQTVLMTTGMWSQRVKVEDLVVWVKFYRRLWGRGSKVQGQPGPWAKHHEAACLALEALQREVKGEQ